MARQRRKRADGADMLPAAAQPSRPTPRRIRLEGDVHRCLTELLGELRDPRLVSAVVTRVLLSDDLQSARAYVRVGIVTSGAGSPPAPAELLKGLQAANGRIRSRLAAALSMRRTPSLRFLYDDGPEAAQRVDELLAEIHREHEAAD